MNSEIQIVPMSQSEFTCSHLVSFMRSVDHDFKPPLGERVNIEEYCAKLIALAQILIARKESSIVGIAAFYCNDQINRISYLTYIAVSQEV